MESPNKNTIVEFLREWLLHLDTLEGPVELDRGLEELGLDSLSIADLSVAVRKSFQVEIKPSEINPYATVDEVAEMILKATAQHHSIVHNP
ncbi:acyl carrier protein [Streptomyces sp. NPDC020965]|uniref:acyl carrier protein n=1 Tax=Streptomyces sp. NPDC020965 TaxID=3365105 RepID=UPI00379D6BF0